MQAVERQDEVKQEVGFRTRFKHSRFHENYFLFSKYLRLIHYFRLTQMKSRQREEKSLNG